MLNAGAIAGMKSTAMMIHEFNSRDDEDKGLWHDLGDTVQEIIVVYVEQMTKKVYKQYQNSVGLGLKHKEEMFKEEEENHIHVKDVAACYIIIALLLPTGKNVHQVAFFLSRLTFLPTGNTPLLLV